MERCMYASVTYKHIYSFICEIRVHLERIVGF